MSKKELLKLLCTNTDHIENINKKYERIIEIIMANDTIKCEKFDCAIPGCSNYCICAKPNGEFNECMVSFSHCNDICVTNYYTSSTKKSLWVHSKLTAEENEKKYGIFFCMEFYCKDHIANIPNDE